MTELEELNRHFRRFEPHQKCKNKEKIIDDTFAALESKVKYALESKKEQLKLDYKNAEKIYERLDDLREIIGNDEIDEEMREGIRQEFDEMKTAYPNVWNNPPPHNTDFRLEPLCIISNDQDGNDCTALEPYVEPSQSKSGSNSSRKSSKESLPYRYVEETSPNTSDTASSVVSYPSVSSRAPSELSIETNNTESRAHSTISAGDNISSVSSVPSRGTSSYGRARGLFRRGQVRNTRGGRGGIRGGRSIDRPISPRAESAVKYTGPSYETDECHGVY